MYRPHIKKEGNSVQNKYLSPKISLHNTTSNIQQDEKKQKIPTSIRCHYNDNWHHGVLKVKQNELLQLSTKSQLPHLMKCSTDTMESSMWNKTNCYSCPRNLNCIIWWNVQFNGIQNPQQESDLHQKSSEIFTTITINESGK